MVGAGASVVGATGLVVTGAVLGVVAAGIPRPAVGALDVVGVVVAAEVVVVVVVVVEVAASCAAALAASAVCASRTKMPISRPLATLEPISSPWATRRTLVRRASRMLSRSRRRPMRNYRAGIRADAAIYRRPNIGDPSLYLTWDSD